MEPASWSPAVAGLHLDDDQNSRMARSSAALADIVRIMQLQPWLTIQDQEDRLRAKAGAFQSMQAWLTESVTDAALEKLQGHRTLEKLLAMLGHPTELLRQLPPEHARAFILQALTSALKEAESRGHWELARPPLGLDDPDRKVVPIVAPAEDVATVAYAKKEKMLAETINKAGKQKDDD